MNSRLLRIGFAVVLTSLVLGGCTSITNHYYYSGLPPAESGAPARTAAHMPAGGCPCASAHHSYYPSTYYTYGSSFDFPFSSCSRYPYRGPWRNPTLPNPPRYDGSTGGTIGSEGRRTDDPRSPASGRPGEYDPTPADIAVEPAGLGSGVRRDVRAERPDGDGAPVVHDPTPVRSGLPEEVRVAGAPESATRTPDTEVVGRIPAERRMRIGSPGDAAEAGNGAGAETARRAENPGRPSGVRREEKPSVSTEVAAAKSRTAPTERKQTELTSGTGTGAGAQAVERRSEQKQTELTSGTVTGAGAQAVERRSEQKQTELTSGTSTGTRAAERRPERPATSPKAVVRRSEEPRNEKIVAPSSPAPKADESQETSRAGTAQSGTAETKPAPVTTTGSSARRP